MYEAATKSYQEANFLSADPLKLIRMCYEGAISNLKIARDAYIDRDYETKAKALMKVLDIIHELNASLDMGRGAEIAKNLRALYLYMIHALTEADLKNNLTVFDDIIRIMEELGSAWQELGSGHSEGVGPSLTVLPYEARKAILVSGTTWSA